MTEFFDWTTLATFAGCLAATGVITQFIKETKPLKNIATQWVSYGIALVLLFAATYFTGGLTASVAAILPLDAIAIALGANGAFSAIGRVTSSNTDKSATTEAPVSSNPVETKTEDQEKAPTDNTANTETK